MHALKYDSPFLSTNGIILDAVRSKARCFSKLYYSHVKREGNTIAFVLIVLDYRTWMEDAPLQFLSFVSSKLWFFSLNKRHFVDSPKKKKKGNASVFSNFDIISGSSWQIQISSKNKEKKGDIKLLS